MAIYFTSDLHFNHNKIIRYCNRPFSSVEEMNEALITNWNRTVTSSDVIYMLGDFCMGSRKECQKFVDKLNGNKVFLIGNHDRHEFKKIKGLAAAKHYHEIHVDKQKIILSHYPMRSWNSMRRNSIMLHGHCHGTLEPIMNSIDVGVDCNDYRPISYDEVLVKLREIYKPYRLL